jgi:hypothetical protein
MVENEHIQKHEIIYLSSNTFPYQIGGICPASDVGRQHNQESR